jgi:acylphosphatase
MSHPPPHAGPPTLRIARRCYVSGRVQGVNYRASARRQAQASGITGYARNLVDGRVEVLACGPQGEVQAFIAWLWAGPTAAKVTAVVVEELEVDRSGCPPDFSTG